MIKLKPIWTIHFVHESLVIQPSNLIGWFVCDVNRPLENLASMTTGNPNLTFTAFTTLAPADIFVAHQVWLEESA